MSNLTRNELIGKRVILSIGEPWDFDSPDGQNKLMGVISEISKNENSKRPWVLLNTTPFEYDNKSISQLIGHSRHVGCNAIEDLLMGRSASCNFIFKKTGLEIHRHNVENELIDGSDKSWLIGGMKIK